MIKGCSNRLIGNYRGSILFLKQYIKSYFFPFSNKTEKRSYERKEECLNLRFEVFRTNILKMYTNYIETGVRGTVLPFVSHILPIIPFYKDMVLSNLSPMSHEGSPTSAVMVDPLWKGPLVDCF